MRATTRRRILAIAGLAAVPALSAADDFLFGRRLRRRCGLPPYPYPQDGPSNPVSGGSFLAVLYPIDGGLAVNRDVDGRDKTALKTFQLSESSLTNGHCRISQVTVTISSGGNWFLHLVAEQNPAIVEPIQRPQYEEFRRNLLIVDVRPTGLMTLDSTEDRAFLGKPEFPEIPRQEFWVRKGQVARFQTSGTSDGLARFFAVLDQVEVHFSWR